MTIKETINNLELLMADIEWDKPMGYSAALEKAVDILNKIEDGRMLEIMFEVGDKIYQVDDNGKIYGMTINQIEYYNRHLIYETCGISFDNRAVGSSIFRTEEEAIRSIRERV